jgi:hypothetical protein
MHGSGNRQGDLDCGSDDVLCDAYAEWDVLEQQWSLQNIFDKGAWCNACDGETTLKEVKLTEAEYRAGCQ